VNVQGRIEGAKKLGEMWRVASDILIPREYRDLIVENDGEVVSDPEKVAEVFNEHFIRKIDNLRSKIDESTKADPFELLQASLNTNKPGKINQRPNCSLTTVKEAYILKIIRGLANKSSSGVDGIMARVIKSASSILVAPITYPSNSN